MQLEPHAEVRPKLVGLKLQASRHRALYWRLPPGSSQSFLIDEAGDGLPDRGSIHAGHLVVLLVRQPLRSVKNGVT